MRDLRYKHEKNCWTVSLFSDGTIEATNSYKNRVNITHRIPPEILLISWYQLVPGYVMDMLLGVRYEWKGVDNV